TTPTRSTSRAAMATTIVAKKYIKIDENQPSRTHPHATHIHHACNTGRILQQVPDEEGHTTSNMTINHNHVSTKQHFHAIG
ncbi:hypothetical protein ACFPVT_10030, partial [Corynebacterium choanae]|uniref:hypothetical protein n=1 Tax=Corynebacterium choanae TaxID=1862358 RepID=UPI00361F4E40